MTGQRRLPDFGEDAGSVSDAVQDFLAARLETLLGTALSREVVDECVIDPLRARLDELKESGQLERWAIEHRYDESEYAQGVVSLSVEFLPAGGSDVVVLRIGEPPPVPSPASNN
jgi:hypothetical protein